MQKIGSLEHEPLMHVTLASPEAMWRPSSHAESATHVTEHVPASHPAGLQLLPP